jgi:hypothetical protein
LPLRPVLWSSQSGSRELPGPAATRSGINGSRTSSDPTQQTRNRSNKLSNSWPAIATSKKAWAWMALTRRRPAEIFFSASFSLPREKLPYPAILFDGQLENPPKLPEQASSHIPSPSSATQKKSSRPSTLSSNELHRQEADKGLPFAEQAEFDSVCRLYPAALSFRSSTSSGSPFSLSPWRLPLPQSR